MCRVRERPRISTPRAFHEKGWLENALAEVARKEEALG